MATEMDNKSQKVLIIDDDPVWRTIISDLASYLGHRSETLGERSTDLVNQVETVLQAAIVNGDPFTVVTIDWAFEMGKGQLEYHLGQQILRSLKQKFPLIACILISASTDAAYQLLNLRDRYNLDTYIPKVNLNEDTFAGAIKKGIERVQVSEQHSKTAYSQGEWLEFLENLHGNLVAYFSKDELKNLCFWLGVDYENLDTNTKDGTARELIQHVQRHGRLPTLLEKCKEIRPLVSW